MDTSPALHPSAELSVSLPANSIMLKARVRLTVTRLFRNYLYAFEEVIDLHDEAMKKLAEALPPEYRGYLDLAEYLTEARVETFRKRVLTAGNDVIRDLESDIDNLRLDHPAADPTS